MSPARPPSASSPVGSVPPRAAHRVRSDWAELSAPTPHPAPFDPATVAGLPEPARRYLTHAIAPGAPLWQSVEISMAGRCRRGRPIRRSGCREPGCAYRPD